MKKIVNKLSITAQNVLGKTSTNYKFGAKIYYAFCEILSTLAILPPHWEINSVLVRRIARQSKKIGQKKNGKHIVFLSTRGWSLHLEFEILLASLLRSEGNKVTILSCNDSLPFCMNGSVNELPEDIRNCKKCISTKQSIWGEEFDIEYLPRPDSVIDSINALVNELNLISACENFSYDGSPYGELVRNGIVWYLRRSKLSENDIAVYKSALSSAHAIRRGLESFLTKDNVDTVIMLNGDFSTERIASWFLKSKGIRYITYDFTFNELIATAVNNSVWNDITFDTHSRLKPTNIESNHYKMAEDILRGWREYGGYQGHLFWKKEDLNIIGNFRNELGFDDRPLATAYTNMTYESSVIGKDRAFSDQFYWLRSLLEFFKLHQEFQLAVRIHPAEARDSKWRPKESLFDYVRNELAEISSNIKIISPQDKISSYALGVNSDAILVYSSTLGIEMADRRKTVITAANVHYAGRGFTIDPSTEAEYFSTIDRVLRRYELPSEQCRENLVNYIAWLFFYRLVPFEAMTDVNGADRRITVRNLKQLSSKKHTGIQCMVDLILERK